MSSPSSDSPSQSSVSSFGDCSMCLSELIPSNTFAITKCGHTFHRKCIQKWLKTSFNCPTCRSKANKSNLIKLIFNGDSNDNNVSTSDDDSASEEDSVSEEHAEGSFTVNRTNSDNLDELSDRLQRLMNRLRSQQYRIGTIRDTSTP